MTFLGNVIVVLYGLSLTIIFLYTLIQLHLVVNYLKSRRQKKEIQTYAWPQSNEYEYPHVTVQLPVFNESYVVERLIDSVAAFHWPQDKLEIQVLDDSNDETVDIVANKVEALKAQGIDIVQVRRDNREGYKAGALEYGQKVAKGEFIAVFDADFVPKADFLLNTVHYFNDPSIGLVQARWGHINQDYSLMTKVQAFALNAHFTVEQMGRNKAGYLMNFNGTGGIWRKETIQDAGGWQHDTITEDLDLSYRAQLKGWKFHYLEDVVSPAELPVAMSALKTQQYRWTKGSAETARKHMGNVWSSKLPVAKKLHATSHLLSGGIFLFILTIAILSVPLLWVKTTDPSLAVFFNVIGFYSIGLLFWFVFYGSSNLVEKESWKVKGPRLLLMFPLFLSFSMGMSVHNALAALRGYLRQESPFIRTPKFNITNITDSWKTNKYLVTKMSPITIIEGILTLYFVGGIAIAFKTGDFGLAPFHVLLALGFGSVFSYSIRERFLKLA